MPVVSFDYQDFSKLLGYPLPKKKLIDELPMIGADFDSMDGDTLSIEFFPDRPDLASVEGIARAARTFFGFESGLTRYTVSSSDVVTHVDESVKMVRPFVTTALVKDVTMTDALIASLMDLQEKLHFGLGRNRRKVAIGVHNFEPVEPPFTYKAVDPDSVEFVPLGTVESMTLREILQKHEKGVDYAHLLSDAKQYPLIVDSNNNVLSFPPVINGSLTEVTPFTSELFIDVTGTDIRYINYALAIVVTSLAERGGHVYTTQVNDAGKPVTVPDFTPQKHHVLITYINKLLGTNLTGKQIVTCLQRMGYDATAAGKDKVKVSAPVWRSDILHEIDIVEDVAIGYGFDKFTFEFPHDITFGEQLPRTTLYQGLRQILIGLGFNEVTTFTISNERDEFTRMGFTQEEDHVTIANPVGEEYSCLRVSLLPSLLKILRENRHHALPQKIFELGFVMDGDGQNHRRLAGLQIDAKASFTDCKSLIEAVLRDIGISYIIKEYQHPGFIQGRCASIASPKKTYGYFGEIHPRVITDFELGHPLIGFELYVDALAV